MATALLIGVATWTVSQLISGVVERATLEYDVHLHPAKGDASTLSVELTNLSHQPVSGLEVALGSKRRLAFENATCSVDPPSFIGRERDEHGKEIGEETTCSPEAGRAEGVAFKTYELLPENHAQIKATCIGDCTLERLDVRVRVQSPKSLRLLRPGIATWVAREEVPIYIGLLSIVLGLLGLSLYLGVRTTPTSESEAPRA